MHIRKLELQGFKSFPDRTSFHFGAGISGVVGPNGCGKSNVVDAVKWCLGEQSARSLRGQAMMDLIFSGSEGRAATGLAEVTITLSADDEPFPGEFARYEELQVTRRLFRSGQSEYLINQQRVRLRDITDLFLDSGAANRLYSFIEQGRIGQIVKASPEQRRTLIEEAAGISRFKARRDEAQGRLEATLRNLERVQDVLDEQASRLKRLERQVGRAMRFRRLRSHVRVAEIFIGLAGFAGLGGDRRALAAQVREAEAEEARLIRNVTLHERAQVRDREALDVMEDGVGRLRDRVGELEASRREKESARVFQQRELSGLLERTQTLQEQAQAATERGDDAERRGSVARTELSEAQERLSALESRLAQARATLRTHEESVRKAFSHIEEARSALMKRVKASARVVAERDAATARLAENRQRRTELLERGGDAASKLEEVDGARAQAQAAVASASEAAQQARGAVRDAEASLVSAREAVREADTAFRAADTAQRGVAREEATARARLDSLEALQAQHAGVEGGARAVLGRPGVLGTLAEHLDVDSDLEGALAVALGPALDAVLVQDDAVAARVGGGVRGHLLLISVDGAVPAPSGFAAHFRGTEAGRTALARLLGDCQEASDLKGALSVWRDSGAACVVTGERPAFVSREGVVRLGAPAAVGLTILARKRDITAARGGLEKVEARLVQAEAALEQARAQRDSVRQTLDQGGEGLQRARAALVEAEGRLRNERITLAAAERSRADELGRKDRLAAQLARAEALIVELDQVIADSQRSSTRLEAEQAAWEALLSERQSALTAKRSVLETARSELESLASTVAGLRERRVGLQRVVTDLEQTVTRARAQVEAANTEIAQSEVRIEQLRQDDLRLEVELQELGETQAKTRAQLEEEREQVKRGRAAIASAETEGRKLRESREAATAHRLELDRQLAKVKSEIARIRDSLRERHDVSVAGLLDRMDRVGSVTLEPDEGAVSGELPDVAAPTARDLKLIEPLRIVPKMLDDGDIIERWAQALERSRAALSRLGEVNLIAVREYQEVRERTQLLEAQRDDLDTSVRSVRKTIGKLNHLSRERFRDTFDRVNEWFQQLYPRLVGGGKARLRLTDEEDLLVTGVEIFVQPPGKRLQNLSLLSGGETAMVAIALIFALFRVKPSPFCLLDEVDAPLDEGNGARFNTMLVEMSEIAQFIVITHNRKTMECADTLYGVTMPSPGVSRLVTVQMG